MNNVAIDIIKPAEELTADEWDRVLAVDLKGPFLCAQATARQMRRQGKGGSIIHIASIAATAAIRGLAPYSAAKAGLCQLTRVLALELADAGIRVNVIAAGYLENVMAGASAEHAQPEKERLIKERTMLGRRGRLAEFVGPTVFLACEASTYLTGAILYVDGGYTAW